MIAFQSIAVVPSEHAIVLPPPKAGRTRPLVAIIADNAGTETTDLIIPYGIFRESGTTDVVVVSTRPGNLKLLPALQLKPDYTAAQFDETSPAGADILIVPAMYDNKNLGLIEWIREQARKETIIVSICEGAWIVARAGVFDGKSATTHWYAIDKMARCFPKTKWVRNRRYIVDGNVMSTTGITASIPASLALVEAIAGQPIAKATAKRLGVEDWDAAYDSTVFRLTASRAWRISRNALTFWSHETIELPVDNGFDEIALALVADAWSRTYCSWAIATHGSGPVQSCRGLIIIPDGEAKPGRPVMMLRRLPPAAALDQTLLDIHARYGKATADIVALQLEYPAFK